MTDTEKYFIHLLFTHLNNETPNALADVNWSELYKLAGLHNLTGIIALELKKLPAENQPPAKAKSYFNQNLGYTIQNCEFKQNAINEMIKILSNNKIMHTIIKGGAIRQLYPVPSVRTSGDTDVVINQKDLNAVSSLLQQNGFELKALQTNQVVLENNNQEFQFKTFFDSIISYDYNEDQMTTDNGYTYYLKPLECLHYVILHMIKHLKGSGFGFRQLMDVDVIIRAYKIDFNKLLQLFDEEGLTKSASVILAITKQLFNTPFDFEYIIDESLYNSMIETIMSGGVFGFNNADVGTVRLSNSSSKFKALLDLLFPAKEYIYNNYIYTSKCKLLLPIGYIHRFFEALFKRGRKNKNQLKSIVSNNDMAIKMADIKNELEI